ncbi:hypothetical protein Bca4012_009818 [Brassica carinata]
MAILRRLGFRSLQFGVSDRRTPLTVGISEGDCRLSTDVWTGLDTQFRLNRDCSVDGSRVFILSFFPMLEL